MRRLIVPLLIISALLSCGRESDDGFKVIAVDFPSYDAARSLMGTEGLSMLLPPGVDVHNYEPSPKDAAEISKADLVVYTGGESDSWVEKILSSTGGPGMAFKLIDCVDVLSEEVSEGMEGTADGRDEHVWTSPVNEMKIVNSLASVLKDLNPEKAEEYERGRIKRIEDLERVDFEIRETVSDSEKKTLIFASRFPLLYFVREYGLDYYAAFPGCAEETEPSARTIAFLIDKARSENSDILRVEMSSASVARVIAKEAGVGVHEFYSMHSISGKDFSAGEDYISLMERNIEVLREVLN